jgi:PAS domain S-box-containing protein
VSDGGTADLFSEDPDLVDPQVLLDALDGRADDMARRAFDIFQTVFPEAAGWPLAEQARFIEQSRRRFEAILAVTEQGGDDQLAVELEEVGAAAAWSGSSLPQLLVVLRISRDLVVQTAVEVAEERGRHWGLALSLLLTRVLPAMDRLTDAIARGYWGAVVGREEEARVRHESVVEAASDGIYELDLDGRIRYANPSLAVMLGRRLDELEGARLSDVLQPAGEEGSIAIEALAAEAGPHRVELSIVRPDDVRRDLDVLVVARREGEAVAGYQGIVRDLTAAVEVDAQKNELLRILTSDLRQPLATIVGLGATLEEHATDMHADRMAGIGSSIRKQAERLSRLADDLDVASRIEARALLVSGRRFRLAPTIRNALYSVPGSADVRLVVPASLEVQADPRRVEQVVANLVENALEHGSAPVVVTAEPMSGAVAVSVVDSGPGVDEAAAARMFSSLRPTERWASGLSLVRGLVEAMGGRAWYERAEGGGSAFRFTLPTPMTHQGAPG